MAEVCVVTKASFLKDSPWSSEFHGSARDSDASAKVSPALWKPIMLSDAPTTPGVNLLLISSRQPWSFWSASEDFHLSTSSIISESKKLASGGFFFIPRLNASKPSPRLSSYGSVSVQKHVRQPRRIRPVVRSLGSKMPRLNATTPRVSPQARVLLRRLKACAALASLAFAEASNFASSLGFRVTPRGALAVEAKGCATGSGMSISSTGTHLTRPPAKPSAVMTLSKPMASAAALLSSKKPSRESRRNGT
mmetsp:Transcript_86606/g.149869  ORF Transcript_86606/g.149869 Transcript_86606/m.149869 type:complete len:250 (-) Transcript_86606:1407-2156(-)